MAQASDLEFKVVFIGDSGVGKTCVLQRLDNNTFSTSNVSTIGMDMVTKHIDSGSYRVKLQMWDTAGQERFRAMVRLHSRGARGIFMMYAANDPESFQAINEFYESLVSDSQLSPPVVILVANKVDMENQRLVTSKQGKDLAKQLGVAYFETSAKTGEGIVELAQHMTDELVKIVESTQTALPKRAKSGALLMSPFRIGQDQKQPKDDNTNGGCSC